MTTATPTAQDIGRCIHIIVQRKTTYVRQRKTTPAATTSPLNSVEGALTEVKRALLDADVNLKVTNRLIEAVKNKAVGAKLVDGKRPGVTATVYRV